jgi:hypothetical protein
VSWQRGGDLAEAGVGETQKLSRFSGVHDLLGLRGLLLGEREHSPDALLGNPCCLAGDPVGNHLFEGRGLAHGIYVPPASFVTSGPTLNL